MWFNVAVAFACLAWAAGAINLQSSVALRKLSLLHRGNNSSVSPAVASSKQHPVAFRRSLVGGHLVSQELKAPNSTCFGAQDPECKGELILCGHTMDAFILADVSGSVGNEGVLGTQLFLARLVAQMQVGSASAHQLLGLVEVGDEAKLLAPLTDNRDVFVTGIGKLEARAVAANLPAALSLADAGFMHGRQDAHSLVVAIVDGPVLGQNNAVAMASHIGQYAGLLVVLVASPYDAVANRAVKEWLEAAGSCTRNYGCRLIQVEDYQALATIDIVPVIAEMCPNLVRVQQGDNSTTGSSTQNTTILVNHHRSA